MWWWGPGQWHAAQKWADVGGGVAVQKKTQKGYGAGEKRNKWKSRMRMRLGIRLNECVWVRERKKARRRRNKRELAVAAVAAAPTSMPEFHIELEARTVWQHVWWSRSVVCKIDGADKTTAPLRGSVVHLSGTIFSSGFILPNNMPLRHDISLQFTFKLINE